MGDSLLLCPLLALQRHLVGGSGAHGDFGHLVADSYGIDHFLTFHHFAENGIVHIQEVGGIQGDIELAAGGIGIVGAGHGQSAFVVLQVGLHFQGNTAGLAGGRIGVVAGTGATGAAALNNKAGLNPVETQAVVKALAHKIEKVIGGGGYFRDKDLHFDGAFIGFDGDDRI